MRNLLVIIIVGAGLVSGEKRFIDLTHTFGQSTRGVNWPFLPKYNYSANINRVSEDIVVVLDNFQLTEHFGTHIDVPYHFCPKGQRVHQVHLNQTSGPGAVLDFKSEAETYADYIVTVNDILKWERRNGPIPRGAVVLINFGWSKRWPDAKKVFGTNDISNTTTYHMPVVGIEAARYLSGFREVAALGVDTPTPELLGYDVHINFLCEQELVILENVDNLDAMPATGTYVYIAPFKLENGGGGPVRMFAVLDEDGHRSDPRLQTLTDLSHTLGYSSVNWPFNPQFNFSLVSSREIKTGVVMVINKFQTALHFNTHMDAPYHFCPTGRYVHELTIEDLSGPGVIIDLKAQAEKNDLYIATLQDVLNWEAKYGNISEGSIVMFNFGWSKYWPDAEKTFGSKDVSNVSSYRYPSVNIQAALYLADNRNIHAIGVDSPTPDITGAPIHVNYLCQHGLLILEMLTNLDAVPANGSYVYIGAPKLEKGAGVPVRVFAVSGSGEIIPSMFCISLILSMITLFLTESLKLYV